MKYISLVWESMFLTQPFFTITVLCWLCPDLKASNFIERLHEEKDEVDTIENRASKAHCPNIFEINNQANVKL